MPPAPVYSSTIPAISTTPTQYGKPTKYSKRNPPATRLPATRIANAIIIRIEAMISTGRPKRSR